MVTSKGKYLSLSHNCVVDEMVKEIHVRQEVAGSNRSHCNVPLFFFDAVQRHRVIHHPVLMGRAFGLGCLVPVVRTGTKGIPRPVPKAVFLVVSGLKIFDPSLNNTLIRALP